MKFGRKHTGFKRACTLLLRNIAAVICFAGISSSHLAAAELNISQNQLPVSLGLYLDYFEDIAKDVSIADILRTEQLWQRSNQATPTMGLNDSAFWFSIKLSGEDMAEEDLLLMLESPGLNSVEFYIVRDGQVVDHIIAGDTIPMSELRYPYRFPIAPFSLGDEGSATWIYLRVASNAGIEIPLTLTTLLLFAVEEQSSMVHAGILLSFFLLCTGACAVLYYYIRDKQFVGYTLLFASLSAYILATSGVGRIMFWGEAIETNSRIGYIAAVFLIMSFSLIGQCLRFESTYRDSVNIVLKFIGYAMLPLALYYLIVPIEQITAEVLVPAIVLLFVVGLTVLVMAAVSAMQGSRSAMYLVSSWVVILLTAAIYISYKIGMLEKGPMLDSAGVMLLTLAALMLLASLAEFVRGRNEEFDRVRQETKAKGDFLRNISREFLTPVHLILANSKRLLATQSNKLDDGTKAHLGTVIKQSDHLHNLINDLLEMAELESDNFEPEFELVEISHFLSEVKGMMLPSALEKELDISTEFAAANLLVQTDRSRLQHALLNIITNAIKFTEEGSIIIGYKAVYFRRRLGIEIFVRDTGKGMSEVFQKRLFQEFAKEDEDPEKDPQGTGLGLVIVKRMIEKLGGEISFESTAKRGSEFFIRLPLRNSSD